MIIAMNSYLDIGAFAMPLRKDSHCSSLHHLDLTTGATSRTPETAFPTISVKNIKAGTVLAVQASTATEATSPPKTVPANIGHRRLGHPKQVMVEVRNILECGANFSDTLSACDTCKIIESTQQENRNILRPNLSSEHIKQVSADLLGYADMGKYTDHYSGVKRGSFIEEAPSVKPTADSATSQVRAHQLALQRQGSPKQQFDNVSQYTSTALRMDKKNRSVSILVSNTYAQSMASPQAEDCKPLGTSARRSTTSARGTTSKLKHLKVATTAPARKTAFDHRDGLVNYLGQSP